MESREYPLVCIGIPVYNEGVFVQKTLDSLLAQTYANIAIVIADNCSTDNTGAICKEYAARYPHISYQRNERNQGVTFNSRRVLELASGKYFMWASGHDLWSVDHVARCVRLLEDNPGAALAYSKTLWIDRSDNAATQESGWYDTRGLSASARFFTVLWGNMNPVLGIIRMEYMRRLPKIYGCVGSDLLVLAELALMGDILCSVDSTWKRRENRHRESYNEKIKRYKSAEFNLTSGFFDRVLPFARLPIELVKLVFRSKLSFGKKILLLTALVPAMVSRFLDAN